MEFSIDVKPVRYHSSFTEINIFCDPCVKAPETKLKINLSDSILSVGYSKLKSFLVMVHLLYLAYSGEILVYFSMQPQRSRMGYQWQW